MTVKETIKQEIERLPDDVLREILGFIRYLESRKNHNAIVDAYNKLSEGSFEKIWDNKEDSIYDNS